MINAKSYFARRAEDKTKKKENRREVRMALDINKSADFSELTSEYNHKTRDVDYLGMYTGEERTVKIQMDQPRPSGFLRQKLNRATRKYEIYNIIQKKPPAFKGYFNNKNASRRKLANNASKKKVTKAGEEPDPIPKVEHRGITLRQLHAVEANIQRRCVLERWTNSRGELLTPKEVTIYDADKYVIKPFTVEKKQSFVTSLPSTDGDQRPRWVVSHWWGEPVTELIQCVEQFIRDFATNYYDDEDKRGGGMSADTPIWIWAFANNPWSESGVNLENAKMSGLRAAMQVANGRTITILDKNGAIFNRIWCMYEMSLTLIDQQKNNSKEGALIDKRKNSKERTLIDKQNNNSEAGCEDRLSAVYTAHKHVYTEPDSGAKEDRNAIGIITGGATSDAGYIPSIIARELSFPFELITKAVSITVEEAKATNESDRVHILNAMIGRFGNEINNTPPEAHEQYNVVNDVLRGRFSTPVA